tara:strand:- start:25 stop:876 length:852 start_codon:yes stop_codon:yes gene_type:complete
VLIIIFIKKKIHKEIKFNIPVLCIGNIYIGGTGKTPLSIFLAKELKNLKIKPVIIKKFYKNHEDEHLLIKKKNIPLISNVRRDKAILLAENEFNLAILDDGFQDYKIVKNMSIICFHHKQLIGNGYVFPSGPLRESINSINRAQIAIINGDKNIKFESKLLKINSNIKIFYSKYKLINQEKFENKDILAFAGIGNPNNFFDLLSSEGLKIRHTISYPDHYNFQKEEILKIMKYAQKNKYTILTTEKDYLRIEKYKLPEINFCGIDLNISKKEELLKLIESIYD